MKDRKVKIPGFLKLLVLLLQFSWCIAGAQAELIDRSVAFVNDTVITLSDLKEMYEKTRNVQSDISMKEVLTTMINRVLILNEAKRLKFEAKSDDELFNEYVELKVRAFIRIKEEETADFYAKNMRDFKEAPYEAVRDKIEEYLTEKEVNRLLKKQIDELRAKAYVKIVMEELR